MKGEREREKLYIHARFIMYNNLIINYKYIHVTIIKAKKMRKSIHLGISRAPQDRQNFFSFLSPSIVDSWVWYVRHRDLKSKYYSSQLDATGKHRVFLNGIFRFVCREVRRSRKIAIVTMWRSSSWGRHRLLRASSCRPHEKARCSVEETREATDNGTLRTHRNPTVRSLYSWRRSCYEVRFRPGARKKGNAVYLRGRLESPIQATNRK